MADLDSALRQRAREVSETAARAATADREAAAVQLMAEAGRLEKLAANEEVKWFLETYLRPLVDAEHGAALDLKRSASERDNSAHRADLGRVLLTLLPTKAQEVRNSAISAARNLPQKA